MLTDVAKSMVRVTSFIGKELRELARRPGVILSLVLGPFLIMLIFGIGYRGYRDPLVAEIVIPAESTLSRDAAFYETMAEGQLSVARVGDDAAAARDRLVRQEIDIVILAPDDAQAQLRNGEQAVVGVIWNEIDPVADNLARFASNTLIGELNSEIVRRAAEEGLTVASSVDDRLQEISPELIAKPTRAETENVAQTKPEVVDFFGPAVFALVLQHLAITLTALSMVRERLGGQMDLFRVAPLNSLELLVGKYVAYAMLSFAISAVVTLLLVGVLGVPLLSGIPIFITIVALLTFASLGVGLLVSLIADSERQAVQLSMLVLLASVFFSGFVLPVEEFTDQVKIVAYVLPVTHGIDALQDAMLRGQLEHPWELWALAAIGSVLFVLSLMRLRRIMHRAD